MSSNHKDLIVWRRELVRHVYPCTKSFPREETYGLVGQMRRAAERKGLARLIRTAGTQARIEHMLDTGKPLRN